MFNTINGVQASGYGWRNGVYLYEVSALLDGKRETIKLCESLAEALDLHARINAYVQGKYDAEVFSLLNSIKQGRAEA